MNFLVNLQFWPLQSRDKTSQNQLKTERALVQDDGMQDATFALPRRFCVLICTNRHRFHLLCVCTIVDAVRGEMLAALFHESVSVET